VITFVTAEDETLIAAIEGAIGMTLPDHTPEGERPHPTPAPRLHNGHRGGHANAPRPHPSPNGAPTARRRRGRRSRPATVVS